MAEFMPGLSILLPGKAQGGHWTSLRIFPANKPRHIHMRRGSKTK